ncbi:PD-(D/E)XK nuclease-like domain-containing protein [Rhodococcus sp. B10]|uniref:PD-(D/E)XK nuclease-like domain-containing protein n=1 Tax=Rhodococcus sp. B10 TaxID=2695876 RepID=UPI00142FEBA8|nr:PD-(D/E)XK nuclease-like domain-containing protein [Rhodococcus sp. B10]NIL77662.1 Exodeoxyribonuclease 8 [Rhodococcus sp. B10]
MSDIVEGPGQYDGIPDSEYHRDKGSLSSSGARKLLPPSCPAIFKWERDHPPESNDNFDLGHAAHTLVLGEGAEIVSLEFDSWSTKASKEKRDEARAEGKTPLLEKDFRKVHEMAAALRSHPLANILFHEGVAERSMYYEDPETGVMLRARPDWLPVHSRSRLIITDYKTAASANPAKFAKSAAEYGYHIQDPWYRDAAIALGLDDDPAFVFVVQEKSAPYTVSVIELDQDAVNLGRRLSRAAIDIYAKCHANDDWPGWGDDVHQVSLPSWAFYQSEEFLSHV